MKILPKLLVLAFIILTTNVNSQNFFFRFNGNYKYFVGKTEPDSNWRKSDFNDASWIQGYCGIGYGHKFDSTIIDTATSVYLRIKFDVTDKAAYKKLNYIVDYDDALVAYLNGTEIVRLNLGKPNQYIPHDQLADRSHEPTYYNYPYHFPSFGYFIDSATLSKCLLEGTNVLSVQVHNDSVKGSDLSFVSYLCDLTNVRINLNTLSNLCIKQVPLDSSKLPIVVINTDRFGIPIAHKKYNAHMGIIYNGKGNMNRITDPFTDYNGNITVEIRGQISADMPKKSYNVRTLDSALEEQDVKLVGMPKDNDWILYGPILDKSLIRNNMSMLLGKKLGYYEPRTRNCELILNGENLGFYVLMENIKRDSSRVNISKLNPSSTDITGGYIVKFDKPNNTSLQWVYPKKDSITVDQKKYITDYINYYFAVLKRSYFADKDRGYRKYVDEQSLLDYIIVNEVIKNCDSYLNSVYLYKDKDGADGKLKFGPLWDNDLAYGNGPWQNGWKITGWQFLENRNLSITNVLSDTIFADQFAEKWFALRDTGFLKTEKLMNLIDSMTISIEEARIRNFTIWPILDIDTWSSWNFTHICYSTTYDAAIVLMKSWLTDRLTWIDENISKIYFKPPTSISTSFASTDNFKAYPNPFSNKLQIVFDGDSKGSYSFETIDIFGRTVIISENVKLNSGYYELTLKNKKIARLSPGLYILNIRNNGNIIHQEKLIKQ